MKNGKTRFTSRGKLMREFQFYNQLDAGQSKQKTPEKQIEKYGLKPGSRAVAIRLKNSINIAGQL